MLTSKMTMFFESVGSSLEFSSCESGFEACTGHFGPSTATLGNNHNVNFQLIRHTQKPFMVKECQNQMVLEMEI